MIACPFTAFFLFTCLVRWVRRKFFAAPVAMESMVDTVILPPVVGRMSDASSHDSTVALEPVACLPQDLPLWGPSDDLAWPDVPLTLSASPCVDGICVCCPHSWESVDAHIDLIEAELAGELACFSISLDDVPDVVSLTNLGAFLGSE